MAESSNPAEEMSLPSWVTGVIGLLSLPAFLLGLTVPFIGPDEPRYAEVGREMFESGDWITPTLGGYHWFEKPPLLYWFEAFFYNIFGVNEFAARIGPALCGLGVVGCLWLLARLSLGREDKQLGGWFAIIGSSTIGLLAFSHAATTDVVVTLPLTAAMSAFFVFDRRLASGGSGSSLTAPLIAMYLAAGFALLAKGLIGLIFPPAIILVYSVISVRVPSRRLLLSSLWGLPLTLAVAAIWYVPMYVRHGDEFVREFIVRQHFERFTTNVFQHPQPFYFYLWVLPLLTLPWLPFFLGGLWKAIRTVRERRDGSLSPLLLFSLSWLLVPVVFFSISSSKLPGYVLPALPAAVIMSGIALFSLVRTNKVWIWLGAGIADVTLVIVIILLVTILPGRAAQESVKPLLDAANARGYGSAKILLLHADSFSAEFYAVGRLPRDPDGKQHKTYGSNDVEDAIRLSEGTTLVIVPKDHVHQLTDDAALRSEVLAENRESCIVAVSMK